MYYNTRNDIIELADDITGCDHLTVSHLADGRRILHADLVLSPDKAISEDVAQLKLHLTNGVNHQTLTPASTDPAWHEPVPETPASTEAVQGDQPVEAMPDSSEALALPRLAAGPPAVNDKGELLTEVHDPAALQANEEADETKADEDEEARIAAELVALEAKRAATRARVQRWRDNNKAPAQETPAADASEEEQKPSESESA